TEPDAILCDEPTGNLDSANSAEILKLLRGLPESGKRSVVMVTHDKTAAAYGDRLITIRDGLVAGETTNSRTGLSAVTAWICRERPPWRSDAAWNATEGVPYGDQGTMLTLLRTLSVGYFRQHRTRSLLVILSIALGVATLVATQALSLGLGSGIQEGVNPLAG